MHGLYENFLLKLNIYKAHSSSGNPLNGNYLGTSVLSPICEIYGGSDLMEDDKIVAAYLEVEKKNIGR